MSNLSVSFRHYLSAENGITAALQLGALAELKMFGTASKPKRDLVTALGGMPFDYRSANFAQRAAGVDAVFDPIGGRNWMRSYRALGKGGRFIGYGMSAAIEGGRRNMMLAGASFAWLGLMGLVPGKSSRRYSIRTGHGSGKVKNPTLTNRGWGTRGQNKIHR